MLGNWCSFITSVGSGVLSKREHIVIVKPMYTQAIHESSKLLRTRAAACVVHDRGHLYGLGQTVRAPSAATAVQSAPAS